MATQVRLDDWLVIYTAEDGHETVRVTEFWAEWDYNNLNNPDSIARILAKARRLGPPNHDPSWCAKCAFNMHPEA